MDGREGGRLRVVLATIGINIVAVALLTLVPWSDWRSGLALNLFDNLLLLGFVIRWRDGLMARLMLYGLVAGLVELAADAWLVDHTHTLDYSIGGGPMLWRSPLWMPMAWEVVVVQFGYVGLRLYERFGFAGLLMNGVLGAVNIPYYEEMARLIHWWRYSGCRMISGTPYYIILGEFGIAVALGWLAHRLRKGGALTALLCGVAGGTAIYACYGLAFVVIDGRPAVVATASKPAAAGLAALVNGKLITQSEVSDAAVAQKQMMALQFRADPAKAQQRIDAAEKAALDALIDRELVLAEFTKMGGSIKPQYVDEDVNALIGAQFHGDRDAFAAELAKTGMTMKKFRELREKMIIVQVMRRKHGAPMIMIPPTQKPVAEGSDDAVKVIDAEAGNDTVNEWLEGLRKKASIRKF